ncbi:zinc ribbon domain-containing protein [Streptomyces sp. NPDC046977]|uniref:zinc ribbon domain-containing protein n=1 Tax=Streptomyces sp. NPDC046977 TaxID=3154703 RepID=UPI0033E967FF
MPKVWSQTQFELQLRRRQYSHTGGASKPRVTGRYPLSGVLTCGKCGRGLVGHRSSKTQVRAYRCPPTALGGCLGTSISAHTVEEVVNEALTAFLANALHGSTTDGPADGRLTPLNNQLSEQTTRKEDLVQRWSSGALTDAGLGQEDFFQLLGSINKKISALPDAIAAAESATPQTMDTELILDSWRQGSHHQRRALLQRYLHSIEVRPPLHPKGANRSHHVRERLLPHWRTPEEIAA